MRAAIAAHGGQTPAPAVRWGYRVLNVGGRGGNLIASSRPVASPPVQNGWFLPAAALTPDGRALITPDYRNVPCPDGGGTAVLRVVELSARTGRLLRVLRVAAMPGSRDNPALFVDGDCSVLSLGPAGLHALAQCTGFGRLDGTRFTPLPGIPLAMNPARASEGRPPGKRRPAAGRQHGAATAVSSRPPWPASCARGRWPGRRRR